VASGEEALTQIRDRAQASKMPFDLVLLDWKMPTLNGLETARQIESTTTAAGIPFPTIGIMATAQEKQTVVAESSSARFDAVLTKPVTPSHLFDMMIGKRGDSTSVIRRDGSSASPESGVESQESALVGRRFDGARVLLVEDNITNQLVATQFLERRGISVTVANHGGEALDWIEKEHFDLVLMDLHMPVMGGIDATVLIRAMPQGGSLPIVAMTAAVMQDDKDRCHAAGMVDFVGKPVDPDELAAVLRRWLPSKFHGAALSPSPSPSASTPASQKSATTLASHPAKADLNPAPGIPVIPGVDVATALRRLGGDPAFLLSLLAEFGRDQAHAIDEIQSALSTGNRQEAAARLHAIKGAAGNLGATEVAAIAGALEKEVNNSAQIPSLADFESAFRTLLKSIEKIVRSDALRADLPRTNPETIERLFAKLRRYLEARDLVPREHIDELRQIAQAAEGNALLERLLDQIQRFDYDGAMATMSDLSAKIGANATKADPN
jgi:CheY-like chemotaxis protein/HPt (histidine-containing phosphotransfer) domain-containing protein